MQLQPANIQGIPLNGSQYNNQSFAPLQGAGPTNYGSTSTAQYLSPAAPANLPQQNQLQVTSNPMQYLGNPTNSIQSAPQNTQQTNLSGDTGGGSNVPTYKDTSAARAATQGSIDALAQILLNQLAESQGDYDAISKQYGAEEVHNKGVFDNQVTGNEQTREAQSQAALLAAANGSRGLYSTLSSIGALGGTGQTLANRAVANEANIDIGNSNKAFDKNATILNDSYGAVKQQEEQRRLNAKNTLSKTQQQQRYDSTSTEQGLHEKMAGLYDDNGMFGQADISTGRGASLTSKLVENTRPNVAAYAGAPLEYSAPALKNYLAGANDMTVEAADTSTPINGAIYTTTQPREKELA